MALETSGGVCLVIIFIKGRIWTFELLSPGDVTNSVGLFPRDPAYWEGLGDARKLPRAISPGKGDRSPQSVRGSDF